MKIACLCGNILTENISEIDYKEMEKSFEALQNLRNSYSMPREEVWGFTTKKEATNFARQVEEIHSNDIAYVYSDPAEPLDAFQFDDGSWYYTDVSGQDWRIFRRGVFIVCPEHESPVNMSNTWQQSSEAMDEIRKFTNYPEPEPSEGFVTMPDDLFEKLGYEEKRVDVLEYVRHYPKQIKVSKSSVLWDVDDTDIVIAFSQGIGCCDIGFGVFKCKCGNILGEMNFDCGQEYVCLFAADNVQIID